MIIDLSIERLRRQPGKPQLVPCRGCTQQVEVCYIMSDGYCGTCRNMTGRRTTAVLCDDCLEPTRNFNFLCDTCHAKRLK